MYQRASTICRDLSGYFRAGIGAGGRCIKELLCPPQVEREHDHFRVRLTRGDSTCQCVDPEKLSKYIKKVGWRFCTANMIESEKEIRQGRKVREVQKGGAGGRARK